MITDLVSYPWMNNHSRECKDDPCRPLEVTSWTSKMMIFVCSVSIDQRKWEGLKEEGVVVSLIIFIQELLELVDGD